MNTSERNKIFDSSLQPSHIVSSRENAENSIASDCLVGVQSHTSVTRQETTKYSTVPGVLTPAREFRNDNIESSITKSHAGINERNILSSSNILAGHYISQNSDFVPGQRRENEEPHLQSLDQVISQNFDIRGNNLAENVATLVSESDEYHIVGPSHVNVESYCDLQGGRVICRLCEKGYYSKRSFIVHFRIHTGERPYACDKCPKRFFQKIHLENHYKIHSKVKPCPCDMCEKRFYTKIDLDNHYQIHSIERPYACDKCTKRFTTERNLNIHLVSHTREKIYPCDKCDEVFVKIDQLAQHRLTHIGD